MIDITDTINAARRAHAKGRSADLPILRAMLVREAADPLVLHDQRIEAFALVMMIDALRRG